MTREELNQKKQEAIIIEQKKEKAKKITLFFLKFSGLLILGFLIFYIYTSFVSTNKLIIKEERILNSKVNFSKFGWVEQIAKLENISHTSVKRFMRKYMKDFYNNNCYIRKNQFDK